ncbi:hypothetical protein RHGRI_016058 [Rhododendron griersonianum]|uniref:NmrA-like domain-containing protein n=1 Tax=Rhododendron griersonianum TaxID=479676 RepID=A0AAV6JSY1_9ERIC|nr:hypothetical protein RHGRI_016058 [Rhododendron griersonianum]
MAEKTKILIIGATGYIGKFIVEASAKSGHPTFALVRESTVSDPAKAKLIDGFKNSGVIVLHGDLYDHESLVKAIKQVDVVISTVSIMQLLDQVKIIAAIKEVGNVKFFNGNSALLYLYFRYLGNLVRKSYFFFLPVLPIAVFNDEHDIATYNIKAVDDPRTLNKILYIKPPKNIYSFNELISSWEKKIGKTLERIYVPEDQILKRIQESPGINHLASLLLAIYHSVFVKGDQTNFEIEPSFGVEVSELYPDVKYTTVEEYLDQFV